MAFGVYNTFDEFIWDGDCSISLLALFIIQTELNVSF